MVFSGTGFSLWGLVLAVTNPHRLNRLRKKWFLVIPSKAGDLLFFAKPKKKQIPRANPALRNDSLRVFPQPLKPVLLLLLPLASKPGTILPLCLGCDAPRKEIV